MMSWICLSLLFEKSRTDLLQELQNLPFSSGCMLFQSSWQGSGMRMLRLAVFIVRGFKLGCRGRIFSIKIFETENLWYKGKGGGKE
jgi:hypothetical protein